MVATRGVVGLQPALELGIELGEASEVLAVEGRPVELLQPAAWEAKACMPAGRNLTKAEWDQFLGGNYRPTCPQWPQG